MEAPLRILVVDDEPSVTLSLRYVFSGPRYEVTCVDSGISALTRVDANSNPYDVVIVDQKMPGLTGVQLVDAIRGRGSSLKIIVVSANLTSKVREAYELLGVDVMFSKPFNVQDIRSAVHRLTASV